MLDTAVIALAAFFAAVIDTGLGMCYGTILTPALLIAGYSPEVVVPTVLLSQLIVDVVGGITHTKVENFTKKDVKTALIVAIPATALAIVGAFSNINLPKTVTKTYIGVLVTLLGIMMLLGIKLRKTPERLVLISSLAGFNKGFMGGGFGPVVVSGQIVLNHDPRPSIAIGDIAEIPVVVFGLLTFAAFGALHFSPIFVIVSVPALMASFIGPYLTKTVSEKNYAEKVVGLVALLLGIYTLINVL
ncbi:sulfite exporter TauE/SafE family protein [Thermococcus sp. MV5]|uniref:sulfite exporter TauE/SafE family protein n=1 Tax=Thermococcus sp. MV5 TaxID=1638272 RepID=UPI00143B4BC7|nr:sulfite exporter TauE/SafE family protein [Thermococcus sp. MV5]NJE26423.1 sulfite exporter TauE/SafE family protein [Thermococcus sp. MV5]